MMSRWRLTICVGILLPACAMLAGCVSRADLPRMRLGSLPFPGMLSLYEAADPDDLGVHCAGSTFSRFGKPGERERGTLYTRHAGFLDLSHVRESIDWVAYFEPRLQAALDEAKRESKPQASFSLDFCQAHIEVTVRSATEWPGVQPGDGAAVQSEVVIRGAQRLCVMVTTWHEIATWYGHQTVPGVPEHWSAFTWDDTTAHVLGAMVGAKAIRDHGRVWDQAVTHALEEELRAMGVVTRKEQERAAELVRDRWWKGWLPVRRDLDTGLSTGFKVPWLVPEFGTEAAVLEVPSLADIYGHDLRGLISVRITPSRGMMGKLYGSASSATVLEGEAGLLDAVERVRDSMREEFGEGFDQP